MKRLSLFLLLLTLLCSLCGCAQVINPLVKNEATDAHGLSNELHSASSSKVSADAIQAALYFRFLDEPMLTPEYRSIRVENGKSSELAVIEALLSGPSASAVELTRLFSEATKVESVSADSGILFVTLNDALLNDGIPEDWLTLPEWREEAPLRRQLAIQSLAATITETFPYYAVQIMVSSKTGQNLRLDNSYFLSDLSGLSEPNTRNEKLLLTPRSTAAEILGAYTERNIEKLYKYTALYDSDDLKPQFDSFAESLSDLHILISADISSGSVSIDGSRAVLTASLVFGADGTRVSIPAYPLKLVRENGIWKITYSELISLADSAGGGDI